MTRPTVRFARSMGLLATLLVAIGASIALAQELSIKVLVNDDPISDYDIDQRQTFLAITTQDKPGPALKKKATDMIIDERLQVQQGRKLGFTADSDEVNKVLGDMATKNNLDIDGLSTALGRAGVNIKTLRDRISAQIVWQQVVRRKFGRTVQIGEADVDQALSDSGEKTGGASKTTMQLRQVKFSLPSNADQRSIAAKIAAAEALRAKFRKCADVATLVKSTAGAKFKALQEAATLPQPARLLVMNANVGQMTPPTLSPSGIELYAVCGKSSANGDTKVRETTQRKLLNQEMMIRAKRLLRDLRADAFIEYR